MLTGNDLLTAVQNLSSMTDGFSQKRFVDIGQSIFVQLAKDLIAPQNCECDEDIREIYKKYANASFIAAEEFAKVFRYQEDN